MTDDKAEIERLRRIIREFVVSRSCSTPVFGCDDKLLDYQCYWCEAFRKYKEVMRFPNSHMRGVRSFYPHKPDCWYEAVEREFGAEDKSS